MFLNVVFIEELEVILAGCGGARRWTSGGVAGGAPGEIVRVWHEADERQVAPARAVHGGATLAGIVTWATPVSIAEETHCYKGLMKTLLQIVHTFIISIFVTLKLKFQ